MLNYLQWSFKLCFVIIFLSLYEYTYAGDIKISGKVKDMQGAALFGADIVFSNGTHQYNAKSDIDGSYQITLLSEGITEKSEIDVITNYPNPFSDNTYIALNAHSKGVLTFSVYNTMGQKVWDEKQTISAGIFYLEWTGVNQSGSNVSPGLYIYSIIFNGKRISGKFIKNSNHGNSVDPNFNSEVFNDFGRQKNQSIIDDNQYFVRVSLDAYYKINHMPAIVKHDTIIDFTLSPFKELPFKTDTNSLNYWDENASSYKPIFLKGINLGVSPPGFFPGEVGYAIEENQYERWIYRMGEMGFNALRIYTLHPPVFYEKLAQYNESHLDKPLYLFQGIWLDEDDAQSNHDLFRFSDGFDSGIEEIVNCMHGSLDIPQRRGRSYGKYTTDVSQWIMGYIIGREIGAVEIKSTNNLHSSNKSYAGSYISLLAGSPSELWLTARLDKLLTFENNNYHQQRPVSVSSWPTLDPLHHPSEILNTDEDTQSLDFANIDIQNAPAGYFASFHAYPYFPNFINDDPDYRKSSDNYGPNSYLGYLKDLKKHYAKIPLVIAEFGVPSSWGSAHQSFSGMPHGGHSEGMQGEYDIRMLKNMYEIKCGGGMMFAWMDEWWKPTWIVAPLLESKSFIENKDTIPTCQLWLNVCSPEQNFGLIAFDPVLSEYSPYSLDHSNGFISNIQASHDDHFFHLEITFSKNLIGSDTIWVAFDTYRSDLGESVLPNKSIVSNRAEFALQIPVISDTANFFVTQAYDLYGLTSRFNDADTIKQLFHTVTSDGAPWDLMRWKNSSNPDATQDIGKILMQSPISSKNFTSLHGVFVEPGKISVRIPWTMLYVSDPSSLEIVNGFLSYKEGWVHEPIRAITDGIAVSVAKGKDIVNTTSRYKWEKWRNILGMPVEREKAAVPIIINGLKEISNSL